MKKKIKAKKNAKRKISPEVATACTNNKVFQKNIAALIEHHPHVYEVLEKMPVSHDYEMLLTENNFPNIRIRSKDIVYYDQKDPVADVRRQIEDLQLHNVRLAVFLGMGLGYELIYYLSEVSPSQQTTFALVIERDPYLFLAALRSIDLSEALKHPALHLIVGVTETEIYAKIYDYFCSPKQPYMYIKAMQPIYHTSSLRLYKDYYMQTLRFLREAVSLRLTDFGNCPEDSLIGVENMFINLDEIINNPGMNLLEQSFKGKPGIVVTSGPSLNKNKHLLKGLEDKAVIVCADSTLRILIEMGIKPHLVASLERIPPTIRVMQDFKPEDVKDVYYAACPVVPKGAYDVYPGPRVIVYRNFDHFKWLGIERGMYPIKASSGNMAFRLASELGCDPIIVIGQDLAFGEDDSTHASGSDCGERQSAYYERNRIQVPGNLGKPVWTCAESWYPCLRGYEQDVADNQGLVINSTEGGAYINGTVVMPFQEAIDKYLKQPIAPLELIKEKLSAFSTVMAEQDSEKVYKNLLFSLHEIEKIYEQCIGGIEAYEKHKEFMIRSLKEPDFWQEHKDKLPEIDTEIMTFKSGCMSYFNTWQYLMAHIIQSYTIQFEINLAEIAGKYEDRGLAVIEVLLKHAEWFAVIGDLVATVKNLLSRTKAEMIERYGFQA